jgi:hypothetical protein
MRSRSPEGMRLQLTGCSKPPPASTMAWPHVTGPTTRVPSAAVVPDAVVGLDPEERLRADLPSDQGPLGVALATVHDHGRK